MSNIVEPVLFEDSQVVCVGRFGKSIGLNGDIRVSLLTDFPESLDNGVILYIRWHNAMFAIDNIFNTTKCLDDKNISKQKSYYFPITIRLFNKLKGTMRIHEVKSREDLNCLKNLIFYSTIEDTRKICNLDNNEFFYFDIIGMEVIENDICIGIVQDIQEIANTHYLVLDKNFLIPYIDRYVIKVCVDKRHILTQDAIYLNMK